MARAEAAERRPWKWEASMATWVANASTTGSSQTSLFMERWREEEGASMLSVGGGEGWMWEVTFGCDDDEEEEEEEEEEEDEEEEDMSEASGGVIKV